MAAIWPLALPQEPEKTSYSEDVPNWLIRSDMDTGPAKVRYRGGGDPVVISVTYVMSWEQLNIFHSFVVNTLHHASSCFDWYHPIHQTYLRSRIVPQSSKLYTRKQWGNTLWWQVTMQLEVWM